MLGRDGAPKEYFSEEVHRDVIELIRERAGTVHIITALDLLAVVIALDIWQQEYVYRRLGVAVDNDAAKCAMVNAGSAAVALRVILRKVVELDGRPPAFRWALRDPSARNWADRPSRHELGQPKAAGARRRRVSWEGLGIRSWFAHLS